MKVSTLGKIVIGVTIGVTLFTILVGAISVTTANEGRVALGVQSGGKNLSGMTYDAVKKHFADVATKRLTRPAATLTYEKQNYQIASAEIDYAAEAEAAADEAYSVGRGASPLLNVAIQMKCALFGRDVAMRGTYSEEKLDKKLAAVKKAVDRDPVNAAVQLAPNGMITKTKELDGLVLDTAPVKEELEKELTQFTTPTHVEMSPTKIAPFVHDEDVAAIDQVLGSYTTRFYPGSRGDNIAIATQRLSGALIRSQSTLSFNSIVGRRTAEAGYKNAGVIVDGEPAIGIGGGVCQVSTTLYNAILLAGLTPTVRSNHFLPSHYVPAGRDATVADDILDFEFKNPLAHPVYLVTRNTGTAITISVLGTKADLSGKTIALVTEGTKKQPSLYRLWTENGQVVDKEYLHTDTYL